MISLKEGLLSKKNINDIEKFSSRVSFKIADLRTGTVVMFADNTFGVWFEEKDSQPLIGRCLSRKRDTFLCYSDGIVPSICYLDKESFDHDLMHGQYTVVRIYKNLIPKKKLTEDFVDNYYYIINDWVKGKSYIER